MYNIVWFHIQWHFCQIQKIQIKGNHWKRSYCDFIMNEDSISSILIIVLLLAFSAYFSATETAFSSLNKTRLKAMAEKGNARAALALKLSEQYDHCSPPSWWVTTW